jgi:putative transposase
MAECSLSERRACKLLEVDRSSYRYEPQPDRNAALRQELIALARQKPRYGYRRLGVLLERRGYKANHKRLYRLYREERLAVRRLRRKRLVRPAATAATLNRPNQEWSMDFVMDGLATGRALRLLPVVDNYTRECLAIEVDSCLSSQRVTRVLEWVMEQRGKPDTLRCDNELNASSKLQRDDSIPGDRPMGRCVVQCAVSTQRSRWSSTIGGDPADHSEHKICPQAVFTALQTA